MNLRLVVLDGPQAGEQRELTEGRLLLGRGSECDLQLGPGQGSVVSGRHAAVERQPDGFYVADQQSTNGTLVNGRKVVRRKLAPGDLIQLSRRGPRLHVVIEGEEGLAKRDAASITFYHPDRDRTPAAASPSTTTASCIGVGLTLLVAGALGVVIMLLMMLELGIGGALVGTVIAFTPAPLYLLVFLWLDRFDPEPWWALVGAFGWGALVALVISYFVNTFFGVVTASIAGDPFGSAFSATVSAPIIEEFTKGLGIILVLLFMRREFDGVLDGLVYAGIVALGFATVENVFYYGRIFLAEGVGGLAVLMFLRGGLAPFSHSLFTAATGIGCGLSRETHNRFLRFAYPLFGLLGAVILHAMWNIVASLFSDYFLIFYLLVWLPLFLAFFTLMLMVSVRERRIVRRMLSIEVSRGFLSPEHNVIAGSLLRRIGWLLNALGTPARLRARRRFLRALTKLAFCYWHVARAEAAHTQTISLPKIPIIKAEIRGLLPQL